MHPDCGPGLSIGIDIGGTKIAGGLVDGHGHVQTALRRPTPSAGGAAAVLDALAAVIEDLQGQAGRPDLPIGVAAAGWINHAGRVVFSPHLPWRDAAIGDDLQRRLGRPVIVDNDAVCAAVAEHRFGAGRDRSHLLAVTLGTGIGGALLIDGVPYRGWSGLAAEFGHMCVDPGGRACACGQRGCWEQYASGPAFVRAAREAAFPAGPAAPPLSPDGGADALPDDAGAAITRAALAGDPVALSVIDSVAAWLGAGLAMLVAALDPECVVIGGGASAPGELLLTPARQVLRERVPGGGHRPLCSVVAAQLGPEAGLVGAAELARGSAGRAAVLI